MGVPEMNATLNIRNCDVAMIARIVEPANGDLSLAAARAFLKFQFPPSDLERAALLSQKAREGTLTAAEQDEIKDYDRVGCLLAALHSKARKTLKKQVNGRR
jgi:hypothetical protein